MTQIQQKLFALQDEAYRDFQCRLIPTVRRERVIGVRTPQLRALARELAKSPESEAFLSELPHAYYEEDNLHAFIIEREMDFDRCVQKVEKFLPYVDNWGTCDQMNPKVLGRYPDELLACIRRWMASAHPYTVRFGMAMLMRCYLGERFEAEYLDWVAQKRSEEYYVNMMSAWFFASALTLQYDAALPCFEQRRLDCWVHNKAIQKATESRRIPQERKAYLKTLKRK